MFCLKSTFRLLSKLKSINRNYKGIHKKDKNLISLKIFQGLILQRLERQTYSYQKYTLPIKLKNQYSTSIKIFY
jgi:hypothetical protein